MPPSHVIEPKDAFGGVSDTHWFFESQTHAHALKQLSQPVEDNRNLRVLLGEAGTGKTALLLTLLQRLQSSAFTARLFLTQLRGDEFVRYFLQELGVSRPCTDIREAQTQLTRVLEQNFSRGRTVIVAIDEAHKLSTATFQALSELLDCRAAQRKQLRVILAGLPSLTAKLSCPELQPMNGRISGIVSLSPLTSEESASYIRRRLELTGLGGHGRVSDDAIALLAQMADGIPSEINNLCFELACSAEHSGRDRIDARGLLQWAPAELKMRAQFMAQGLPATESATSTETSASETINREPAAPYASAGLGHNGNSRQDSPNGNSRQDSPNGRDSQAAAKGISDWFGYERLAWLGTAGELAAALQQPESELTEKLSASSEALRKLGIAVTVAESSGRTASVSLRALEGRRLAREETPSVETPKTEIPNAEISTSELFPAAPESASQPQSISNENASQAQAKSEFAPTDQSPVAPAPPDAAEDVPSASGPNEAPTTSAFDQILRMHSTEFEHHHENRKSRLGWVITPVLLICALAVIYLLAVRGNRQVRPQDSGTPAAQQLTPAAPGTSTVSPQRPPKPPAAKHTNGSNTDAMAGNDSTFPGAPASGLLRAARAGDPQAQLELGNAYVSGNGVPADTVAGYTWLALAFANGNQQAESRIRELSRALNPSDIANVRRNLGEMYADGIGVHPDKVTAYMWQLLAESAGDTRSHDERDQLARSMTPDEILQAQTRASEWLKKHQASKNGTLPPG